MVDNLLPDHVGLLHVLDLAVHLVQLMTWMGRGGHYETFSLLELFPQSTPSLLKVCGGWGRWVGVGGPCDYCVTPVPIGLGFRFGTALGLRGGDLGLRLENRILGEILPHINPSHFPIAQRDQELVNHMWTHVDT